MTDISPTERKALEAGFDLIETPARGWQWKYENSSLLSQCSDFATAEEAAKHALEWEMFFRRASRKQPSPKFGS
jgi:hypothetical protein